MKTGFTRFQNSKTEFQWQVGKLDEVVGAFANALSHPEQAESYYHWSSTIEPNNPKPSNPKSAKHRPSNPKPSQLHQHNQPNQNHQPPTAATTTSPP